MIRYRIRNFIFGKLNNHEKLNSKFKNKYFGRCFIIGNGPSLNEQDLSLLNKEVCFATNRFVLHKQFDEINPKFYVIGDPEFLKQDNRIILNKIESKLNNNLGMTFFVSNRFLLNNYFRKKFSQYNTFYYLIRPDKLIHEQNNISLDFKRGLFMGNTIIIDFCIPMALTMGFKEIILIGCDMNYSGKSHFYGHQISKEFVAKNYSRLQWSDIVEKSYKICDNYAKKNNVRILNATNNTLLKSIERVEYDNLFKK